MAEKVKKQVAYQEKVTRSEHDVITLSSPLPLCYQRGLYLQPGRLPPAASVLPRDRMPVAGRQMFVYVSVTI